MSAAGVAASVSTAGVAASVSTAGVVTNVSAAGVVTNVSAAGVAAKQPSVRSGDRRFVKHQTSVPAMVNYTEVRPFGCCNLCRTQESSLHNGKQVDAQTAAWKA